MAARTYSHNTGDIVISVSYIGNDYKLVVDSKSHPDKWSFLMCKARRYNSKFHQAMNEVIGRNLAAIRNWYLGNRDNTSEVWRVITAALETL